MNNFVDNVQNPSVIYDTEKFGRNYAKPVVELGSYEEFLEKKQ
jgi:hypothetical protein